MESAPLNAAHEKVRRAEALSREGKFTEASQYHEQAAELFLQAQARISGPLGDNLPGMRSEATRAALDSLNLQRDHHLRQAKIAKMKQVQLDEYKQTLQKRTSNAADKKTAERLQDTSSAICDGYLKSAIYKTIEEQDSLLNLMPVPNDKNGCKLPKDAVTIIEELRTVNKHLRSLVGTLVGHLETKENEVRLLKERLQFLTRDSAIRLVDSHSTTRAPLPPLAPLGMPDFVFPSFQFSESNREGENQQKSEEEEEDDVISS